MFGIRHKLISVFGDAYNGVEEWSFSMRVITDTEPSTVSQAQADAILTPVQAWWNTATNAMPATHRLVGVKIAPIGLDGRYPDGEDSFESLVTPDPGPSAGPIMAPQLSLVISLTTAKPRGMTSKGRFYIPCPADTINAAGQLATQQANIATGMLTLLNAINSALNVGQIAILSNPAAPSFGGVQLVTGFNVGNVIDTQRRRRESIPEVRVSRVLA